MLSHLINPNQFNFYNIEVANSWGLEAAVYFSTLLSLSNLDCTIMLDDINRNIIKGITTLPIDKQLAFDDNFINLGVLEKLDDKIIKINVDNFISLFNTDNKKINKEMSNVVKKKRTKADILRDDLKLLINSTNAQIRDLYAAWIDAVIAKQGWMSKKSVTVGQDTLNNYVNGNIDKLIAILNIASINGYRDIEWAINAYEKREQENKQKRNFINLNNPITNKKIELSKDIF